MAHNGKLSMPQMFLLPRSDDKKVVLEALEHFDGFQVGASTPASTVSFVRDVGKPFFIDPMAYMFALPIEAVVDAKKGGVRVSLETMARKYNALLAQTVGKRSLTADDLLDQIDVLEELTSNVLEYQRTKLQFGDLNLINPYFDKYAALAREGEDVPHQATAVKPFVVIPPYFFFTSVDDPWYIATVRCARIAVKYRQDGERLCPAFFMSQEALEDERTLRQIASDFNSGDFDGAFIWINNMEEASSTPICLAGLTNLVFRLAARGKPVFKLHGGFFSILLHGKGLSAFSCNLSYKTSKDVFFYKWISHPNPKPKFYIQLLHRAYKLDDAARIFKAFPFLKCECKICFRTYGKNLDAFIEQMERPEYCERHFLNARKQEIQMAQQGTPAMLDSIEDTIRRLVKKNATGVRHLTKWRDVLRDPEAVGIGSELLWKAKELPKGQMARL